MCSTSFGDEGVFRTSPINREGEMFNLKIVPGNKSVSVFVVGNKMADFRFTDTGLKAYIRTGNKLRPIAVQRQDDHYILTDTFNPSSVLSLEVSHKNKKENIDVPLKWLRC